MIDPQYIIYHDLIGIKAYAKSKSKKKFSEIGIVIDETRDMLITEKDNRIRKYCKKQYIFRFKLSNHENGKENYYIEVSGNKIVGLPLNRFRSLKKKRRLKR
jgi:RNase P/RNase MRP subunit p29